MRTSVYLTHDDYIRSIKFAMKLWYAGKPVGDWRSTGTRRGLGQYVTDHTQGKLAEIAFAKLLQENWAIKAELDFDIHPGTQTIDTGDLVAIEASGVKMKPGIKVDIKATKPTSLWAMVDLKEFSNRRYDAYIWIKVSLPLNHLAKPIFDAVRNGNLMEIEAKVPTLKEIKAELAGFAYREDIEGQGLFAGGWRKIQKGETVCDPDRPKRQLFSAKTDNYASLIKKLRKSEVEWQELLHKITGA